MASSVNKAVPVLVVRTDGSVCWRMAERSNTPGLVVVAECSACAGDEQVARHTHRRWRVQTDSGYLVGDLSVTSRREALAAAFALGCLAIDWRDPQLALQPGPEVREAALSVLARWGLARAAA